ncbi:hypothetical protein ACFYPN_18135 [Streptomyces sp. NPDC005576]|uniref:hypothetical protein n=1 Tax=unclassified Streptomyces TaxID=2593676 RepID=UPI0033DA7AF3
MTGFACTDFAAADFDPAGFDPADFDPAGFNPAGFDPADFDPAGFDPADFDPAGFESAGSGAADFERPADFGPVVRALCGTPEPCSPTAESRFSDTSAAPSAFAPSSFPDTRSAYGPPLGFAPVSGFPPPIGPLPYDPDRSCVKLVCD